MIVKSPDNEWLAEVESETMGFNHLSAKALMTHLRNVGGSLDHMNVMELISNIQKPWDAIETPATHFARGDKYERQLTSKTLELATCLRSLDFPSIRRI
jgi:hypothetical protein